MDEGSSRADTASSRTHIPSSDTPPRSTVQVGWQLAVDAARIGTWSWDLPSGELRFDDRLLELFGRDARTFGRTIDAFTEAVHPEDRARVTEALQRAIAACGEYDAEYRILLPTGVVRWIAARGLALPGPDGSAVRLLGAAYDTTAVQEGEARVARVLEAMPTAFFHLDSEWRFGYLNAEAERLLGASRSELVGEVIWERFPASVGSDFERYYREAVETGQPVSFDAYYPAPLDAWYEVRAWPIPEGLSVYFVNVTDRHRAQQQLERSARRSALLAAVTSELVGTLDARVAVARLAPLVVPELADWCIATLAEDDHGAADPRRGLRDVGAWHADPAMRPALDRYVEIRLDAQTDFSIVQTALSSRKPIVLTAGAADAMCAVLRPGEAQDLTRTLAPSSAAVLRLMGRDRPVGLLSLFRGAARVPFTAEDLSTMTEVAARTGLALENALLYSEQRDLAEGLQRSLLTGPPEPDHLEIAVRYEPAAQVAQVGGDWYDAFLQEDGATVLVIGDVVGHDTEAAAAMGQVRGLLRGIAVHSSGGPAEVLRGVDRAMALLDLDTTATAVVARLEQTPEERAEGATRLRWSSAGHPPPVAIQADGSVQVLGEDDTDLLLGLDPRTTRHEQIVTLPRGATVLMYTDGLVERRGESYEVGIHRLTTVLADLAAHDLPVEKLCAELLNAMLPSRREDDVAMVVVRLHPEDAPRPPESGPERVPDAVR